MKLLVVPNTKFFQAITKIYENFIKKHKKLEVLRIGKIDIELLRFTLKNFENLRIFQYQLKFLESCRINWEIFDLKEIDRIAVETGSKIEIEKHDGLRKSKNLDLMNPDVAVCFRYELDWYQINIK